MEGKGRFAEDDRIEELFQALAADRPDDFRHGCSDQLLITLRGTSSTTTTLAVHQLRAWWDGLRSLTGGTLGTEVVLAMTTGPSQLVVLRHTFFLDGTVRQYDTVNSCTFRDGLLVAWFSRPLDRREYAEAWGIPDSDLGSVKTRARMVDSATA